MFRVRMGEALAVLGAAVLLSLAGVAFGVSPFEGAGAGVGATGGHPLALLAVRIGFLGAIYLADVLLQRQATRGGREGRGILGAGALFCGAALAYAFGGSPASAWVATGTLWLLLPAAERAMAGRPAASALPRPGRAALRAWLAGLGAAVPVVVQQIESRFADEEFFVAASALVLAAALFLLLTACSWHGAHRHPGDRLEAGKRRRGTGVALIGGALTVAVAAAAAAGYRASFFPPAAPQFAGVSEGMPFLCGELSASRASNQGEDGAAVWERLVARVEAQAVKSPPDLGLVALARQDAALADAFRDAILGEARAGAYTGPANSVKSVQLDAAFRIYYAVQVRRSFPDLFSAAEWAELEQWAAAINRRALRVEWVDWLYAAAFGTPPVGPYANQEIGAGLLATLNWSGMVPAGLQAANGDYLSAGQYGWDERFRNTDDAYLYQTVWLTSAYLQALLDGGSASPPDLAFEWLLLQARPDGTAPAYNHPVRPELAHVSILAAQVLDDPRYVWLASRALASLEDSDGTLAAIPGIEQAPALSGQAPAVGSCLLYGDSGLPGRAGPLAPDKIVLRDGWDDDATVLELNLRFTGWHRYKATNHLAGLFQGGPVLAESAAAEGGGLPAWLPAGRELARDKRIDRGAMNALQVPRRGLAGVLWTLTGLGSRWAQDPPAYARVDRFEALGGLDMSRTSLEDWQGWDHSRTIYLFPGGPVFVVDEAEARSGRGQAAVSWHLTGRGEMGAAGDSAAREMVVAGPQGPQRLVWPANGHGQLVATQAAPTDGSLGSDVVYYSGDEGRLDLVTAYLGPAWSGASVRLERAGDGWLLAVSGGPGRLEMLHNPTGQVLEAGGLATDGLAVSLWQPQGGSPLCCTTGGSEVRLPLSAPPAEMRGEGLSWSWQEGVLTLRVEDPGTARCISFTPGRGEQ